LRITDTCEFVPFVVGRCSLLFSDGMVVLQTQACSSSTDARWIWVDGNYLFSWSTVRWSLIGEIIGTSLNGAWVCCWPNWPWMNYLRPKSTKS